MSEECVFCKIAANLLPSYTICEDDLFKVILDVNPWSEGHSLIILKRHANNIYGLTNEECEKLFLLAAKTARVLNDALKPDGLNVIQNNGAAAGQSVDHFHTHLVPRYKNDGVILSFSGKKPSDDEFDAVAEKIKIVFNKIS